MSVVVDGFAGDAPDICAGCLTDPNGVCVDVVMENLAPGPTPRKRALKNNQKTSKQREQELCELLGARRQPGSGNQAGLKGDGRKKGVLRLEAKFTMGGSYRLELENLQKVALEAEGVELPVFVIEFLDRGTRKLIDNYAIIRLGDLVDLLQLKEQTNAAGKHPRPER